MSIENLKNRDKIPSLKIMPVCKNCKDMVKLRRTEIRLCVRNDIYAYVELDESCEYHTYKEEPKST